MALAKTRMMSLDEAVEAVYQEAMAGRSVAESAAEFAHEIDDRDILEAVRVGLIDLAHRRLARQRRAPEDGVDIRDEIDPGIGSTPPTKAKAPRAGADFWQKLAKNYAAADGTRKALSDFTAQDALYLRDHTGKQADGLLRIRDAMDAALSALSKHKVSRIGELPADEQRKIAEALA